MTLRGGLGHRGVADANLGLPCALRVAALRDEVAAALAATGFDLPVGDVQVALGEIVELVEGQPKRAGDSEVSLDLGASSEKRVAFGSAPTARFNS